MPPSITRKPPLLTPQQHAALLVRATPQAARIVAEVYELPAEERAAAFEAAVDMRGAGDATTIATWAAELRTRDPRLNARNALVKALARYLAASALRDGVTTALGDIKNQEYGGRITVVNGLGVNTLDGWCGPFQGVCDKVEDAYDATVEWVEDRYENVKDGVDWVYTESGARALVEYVVVIAKWIVEGIANILCHPATAYIVGAAVAVVVAVGSTGSATVAAGAAFTAGVAATKGACKVMREAADFMAKIEDFIGSAATQRVADMASAEFAPTTAARPGWLQSRNLRLRPIQRGAAFDNATAQRAARWMQYVTEKRRREAADRRRLAAIKQQARSNERKAEFARKQAEARAARILATGAAHAKTTKSALVAGGLVIAGMIAINRKMRVA